MKNYIIYLIILSVVILFSCDLEKLTKGSSDDDELPVVEAIQWEIISSGSQVGVGDTVRFSIVASNPADGSLSYQWSASAGTIITSQTSGNEVLWRATTGGSNTIKVEVSNVKGTVEKNKTIIVRSTPVVGLIQSNVPNFEVDPGDTVQFWVTATNPEEGELSYDWSCSGGEFIGLTDIDSVLWRSTLSGTFNIEVEVSNDYESDDANRSITVRDYLAPYLKIIEPAKGAILIQHQNTFVTAEAVHQHGISRVDFFVNDILISSLSGYPSTEYEFNWNIEEEGGSAEVKI